MSEPTATSVREAADRLSFQPSRSAQLLARRRPRLIGLVISDLLNETLLTWARSPPKRPPASATRPCCATGATRRMPRPTSSSSYWLPASTRSPSVGPVAVSPRLRDRIVAAGTTLTPGFMHDRQAAGRVRAAAERAAIDAAVDLLADTGARGSAPSPRRSTPTPTSCSTPGAGRSNDGPAATASPSSPPTTSDPTQPTSVICWRDTQDPGALVALNHDLPGAVVATVQACGRAIPDDVALVVFGDSRAARSWTPQTTVITRDMDSEARRHIRPLSTTSRPRTRDRVTGLSTDRR